MLLLGLAVVPPRAAAQNVIPLFGLTNQVWRYVQDQNLDGTGWETAAFDDSGWPEGRALLAFESAAALQPLIHTPLADPRTAAAGTPAPPRVYYFRTHFNFPTNPANSSLVFTQRLDDGAAYFLNGTYLGGIGMPAGRPTYTTLASRAVVDATADEAIILVDAAGEGLVEGDNVLAIEVHQSAATSSDIVWGCALSAIVEYAPTNLDEALPADTNVVQCRTLTLSVNFDGRPAPAFQWFHDDVPIDLGLNPTAIDAILVITNAQASDAGQYYAEASNTTSDGTLTTIRSRTAVVTVTPDNDPPRLVRAIAVSGDPTLMIFSFDEPIAFADTAFDPLEVRVQPREGGDVLEGDLAFGGLIENETNLVMRTLNPRQPGVAYKATFGAAGAGVIDACARRALPDNSMILLAEEVTFQEGVADYFGTQDTILRQDTPGGTFPDLDPLLVDLSDGGGSVHSLLRFDNIVGNSPGQIPPGAIIQAATLVLNTADGTVNNTVFVHRMRVDWNETTATWDSLVGGIDADGSDAESTPDFSFLEENPPDPVAGDVTPSVQAWANGAGNYGWALLPSGSDGYRFDSSEGANPLGHPLLRVAYILSDRVPITFAYSVDPGTRQKTLVLSWPSAPDVHLQCTTDLNAPILWQDVPGNPQSPYTVPLTETFKFYTLRKDP
jgi:hypothetical protein